MAVSPPFVINEAKPASTDLISQHPADERSFRDTVESWLSAISDPVTGLLRSDAFGAGGLTLTSTDTGAGAAPLLNLVRDSASPADLDLLGIIRWTGENSASEATTYGGIYMQAADVTDGTEDGSMVFQVTVAGAGTNRMIIDATGVNVFGALDVTGALTLGTALAVAEGGTGGTTQATARTGLGLGTLSTQNSNSVSISGGTATLTTVTATTVNGGSLTMTGNILQSSGGLVLRPVSGSSLNDTAITSNGDMTVEGSINAEDTVSGTNLTTTGNPIGSTWSPWGSTNGFTAIGARIEARASAYADAAVTSATVGAAIAAGAFTQIGTYILGRRTGGGNVNPGSNIAGTQLAYSSAGGGVSSPVNFGTWEAVGAAVGNASSDPDAVTLYRRVS